MPVWVSSTNIPGCGLPHSHTSGHLLTANSSSLLRFALQTPRSSSQPPSAQVDTHLKLDCGTDCLCKSHPDQPATDRLLHSPLIAPESPLLSSLISPSVRGLPRVWEPLLSFSFSRPRALVLSCFFSSSLSLRLSFILPGYAEIYLSF